MTPICLLMKRTVSEEWITPAGVRLVLTLLMSIDKDRMVEILRDARGQISTESGQGIQTMFEGVLSTECILR